MKLNVVSHATLLSPKTNNQRNEDRLYASVESNLVLPELKIVPEMLTADVGAIAHFKCQGSALDEISGHEITKDGKIELRVKFIRHVDYNTNLWTNISRNLTSLFN